MLNLYNQLRCDLFTNTLTQSIDRSQFFTLPVFTELTYTRVLVNFYADEEQDRTTPSRLTSLVRFVHSSKTFFSGLQNRQMTPDRSPFITLASTFSRVLDGSAGTMQTVVEVPIVPSVRRYQNLQQAQRVSTKTQGDRS